MNDRELLELAAKAAGMKLLGWSGVGGWQNEDDEWGFQLTTFERWNPLTDDGDALRLAVKLRISLRVTAAGCMATDQYLIDAYEPFGTDQDAATRRAITRAAAAIGGSHE